MSTTASDRTNLRTVVDLPHNRITEPVHVPPVSEKPLVVQGGRHAILTDEPPVAGQSAYRVQFVRKPDPPFATALCYLSLAFTVPFIIWRCTIVNWGAWYGPVLLLADLFGAFSFVLAMLTVRSVDVPVHRPVDLRTKVVDCLIATHAEAVEVIEPTVIGAMRIRGIRDVLVLASVHRPEVREMAERHGARYVLRATNAHGKAGNLNNGLANSDADFVMTLDADHIPRPEFLERTLGYLDDPQVAFVQTPQQYYNTDSVMFRSVDGKPGAWTDSGFFYHVIQAAKNRWNSAFFVGTSAVLRRVALNSIGGFAYGTATEDVHTSVRLHSRGWHSVFLPEPLAFGLEVQSMKELHAQRCRWAMGSLRLLLRNADSPLWRRDLTPMQRMNYINATMVHLNGLQLFIYLLVPIFVVSTLVSPVRISYETFGLVFLAYWVMVYATLWAVGRGAYHPVHNTSYQTAIAVSQVIAFFRILGRHARRHSAASKELKRVERTWVTPTYWLIAAISLATALSGLYRFFTSDNAGALVAVPAFFLLINVWWLIWFLASLARYERGRSESAHATLSPPQKYAWVMANFGRRPD